MWNGRDGIETGLGAGHMCDGPGRIPGPDRGWLDSTELIIVPQNATPVSRCVIRRRAMDRRDAGLQMILAQLAALCGCDELEQPARNQPLVPFRSILIVEAQQIAVFVDAGGE